MDNGQLTMDNAQVSATQASLETLPPGYKRTEVGVIPEDWEVNLLPDICWFQEGPGLRQWQFTKTGIKVINVTNLEDGYLNLDRTERHISLSEFNSMYQHFLIDAGDMVMASSGNSYGKTAIVRSRDLPLLMNTSVIRFKPVKATVHGFLWEFINSSLFRTQIDLMITGGAQPNFGPYHLNRVLVPLPPLPEQQAIAEALSDVDGLIASLDKLLTKKRAIKQAAMQQLLTGKTRLPGFGGMDNGQLTMDNAQVSKAESFQEAVPLGYKRTEVGVIPEDWESPLLGSLANIFRGASPRPIDSPVWFDEQSDVGWLRISDVSKTSKYLDETSQNLSDKGIKNSRFIIKDSLVMSICATVGRPIITRKNVCIHDGFVVFENPKPVQEYLFYILSYIEKDWSRHGQTGSQMNLNTGLINSTHIPLPPTKTEQRAIATVLSDMDAEIAALEERRNKTKQIKQGMMQELLTGRVRLMKEAS